MWKKTCALKTETNKNAIEPIHALYNFKFLSPCHKIFILYIRLKFEEQINRDLNALLLC